MLRTSRPVQRRKLVRASREPKEVVLQSRERERRFVPAEAGEWHARKCAQDRAQKALRKHGVLIRLRLVPRAGIPMVLIGQAVETLRREGFIIWSDDSALIMTGEPGIAVVFMDMAASAGILSADLRDRLKVILKSAAWLREGKRPDVLTTVPELMPIFASVEQPR